MRKILFALAISALAPLLTSPASAQVRADVSAWPVCLTGGEDASTRCEFASAAQCRAVAVGGRGSCILNPAYSTSAYAQMRTGAY